jgi:hypothetical protein
MAGSLSTALLTGTTAGAVALLTLGLARAARRCSPGAGYSLSGRPSRRGGHCSP